MKKRGVYDKKNIVITGSTKGLGFELAKDFLAKGMNVTISGPDKNNVDEALLALRSISPSVHGVVCDVTKAEEVSNLWAKAKEKWGDVDIWINNAGINQPKEFLNELKPEFISRIIDTNLKGVIYGSNVAMSGMIAQNKGAIYNMEGLGSRGEKIDKTNIYTTTKRALTHFTESLANEAAKRKNGIIVGLLSPGMMVTDFILKPPAGEKHHEIDPKTKFIFNVLGDKPDTVARFLTDKILRNQRNNVRIEWLTPQKVVARFVKSGFVKRDLFPKDAPIHKSMNF